MVVRNLNLYMIKTDLSKYDNSWYNTGGNVLKRLLWYFCNILFIKNEWNPSSVIKVYVLRVFGAKIGRGVVIKPCVNIKYPWNLEIGDNTWIGEDVWIDNLVPVYLTLDESSNVSLIKTKFENIKTQMNKISKGINSLKNLIPDEDLSNLIKLSTLSEGISKKYKRANSKFMNAISNAQKNIDEQLSVNSDISTLDKSSEVSMSNIMALKKDLQTQNPLINKDRIERLKRVKKEYQQIYDISSSLNQLSEDIKFNTLNQDKQIEIISANINGIDENINKGNEELKKYKEENMVDNTVYYKYIGVIILVIMLFALLIYYKLNLSSSGEVSVSSQIEETFFMKNVTK